MFQDEYISDTNDEAYLFEQLSLRTKVSCQLVGSTSESSTNHNLNESAASNERMKQLENKIAQMEESQTCAICLENKRDVVFLCGHGTCTICADSLVSCHLCRKPIEKKIRIYQNSFQIKIQNRNQYLNIILSILMQTIIYS